MRVLILAPAARLLSAPGLPRAALSGLLPHLYARHEIHLAIVPEPDLNLPIDQLPCWQSLTLLTATSGISSARGLPGICGSLLSKLRQQLRRLLGELRPEIVHLDGLATAPLMSEIPSSIGTIVSIHELSFLHGQRTRLLRARKARIAQRIRDGLAQRELERWLPAADLVTVPSQHDADALALRFSARRTAVIPDPVDLDYYSVRPDPVPGGVVFCGDMSWPANKDTAEYLASEIMPLLRQKVPNAYLRVVATDSFPAGLGSSSLPASNLVGPARGVRQAISSAAVYMLPLRVGPASGYRIAEAMAMGAAIVATPASLAAGPLGDEGRHLLTATSAWGLASAAAAVMTDSELRRALSFKARRHAETAYSWSSVATRFAELYRQAAPIECRAAS